MSLQQISSNCITVHFFVLLLEAIQMQCAATHKASVTVRKDVNVQRNMCKKSCKELQQPQLSRDIYTCCWKQNQFLKWHFK
jgi:hypothetical protein